MVILMKKNKSLVISKSSVVYQKENIVDTCVFYFPETYDVDDKEDTKIDLTTKDIVLYYKTPGNEARMELLEKQLESDKEDYIMCKLPITSKITQLAGVVTLHISFLETSPDFKTSEVLKTGELKLKIEEYDDYFAFISDESLSAIDKRIMELKLISDGLEFNTPNDLKITDDILQLVRKETDESEEEIENVIGDGVEILVPGSPDAEDGSHDGIIDLDTLDPDSDTDTDDDLNFVDLDND